MISKEEKQQMFKEYGVELRAAFHNVVKFLDTYGLQEKRNQLNEVYDPVSAFMFEVEKELES
jgi:hypothetical protein